MFSLSVLLALPAPLTATSTLVESACADPAHPGAISITAESTSSAGLGLTLAPALLGALKIVRTETATGRCIRQVRAVVLNNLYLDDGRGLTHDATSGKVALRPEAKLGDRVLESGAPHPELRSARFQMAFRVGYRRDAAGLATNYVGLWQEGNRSSVRYFSARADGSFTPPRALVTSKLPLRSVTYFPAPDTPSGELGLVQEARGKIKLIFVHWSHPGIFG